jgi:hypothetical protein
VTLLVIWKFKNNSEYAELLKSGQRAHRDNTYNSKNTSGVFQGAFKICAMASLSAGQRSVEQRLLPAVLTCLMLIFGLSELVD